MTAALFGTTGRSTNKHLVEFRAGKMYMQGKTVHPDKRKGLVYLHQADDALMHFCWKDRFSGSVEEDLIIFPDDCEFKKVSQCTTGRVFVLRFKSNNRRFFFWMQESKLEKDDEYCRKINEYLNNPPTPGSQRSTSSTPNPVLGASDLSNIQNSDIHNLIGNISQQQLMQIFGNGVPTLANLLGPNSGGSGRSSSSASSANSTSGSASSLTAVTTSTTTTTSSSSSSSATSTTTTSSTTSSTTTTTTTASSTPTTSTTTTTTSASASSSASAIQLSDLQNILSGIGVPLEASSRVAVDLGSALTAEALQPILTNPEFVEQLRPLLPTTGEQMAPVEDLKGTMTSPQFQQAVNLFTSALQSGQLGPLISQFGLGEEAAKAASLCDVEAFIKALGKKEKGSKKEEEKKKEKDHDKDEDDSMALD